MRIVCLIVACKLVQRRITCWRMIVRYEFIYIWSVSHTFLLFKILIIFEL